jgi:hypothetical protein
MTGDEPLQNDVAISVRGVDSEPRAASTAQLLASMLKHHGLTVFMHIIAISPWAH